MKRFEKQNTGVKLLKWRAFKVGKMNYVKHFVVDDRDKIIADVFAGSSVSSLMAAAPCLSNACSIVKHSLSYLLESKGFVKSLRESDKRVLIDCLDVLRIAGSVVNDKPRKI